MVHRVSPHVDMFDRTARHEQTTLMLEVLAGPRHALSDLMCRKPILGIDTLHHHVQGRLLGAIVFEDAVGFVRPHNLSGVWSPTETARVTEPLSFGQISFAPPEHFFGNF